jgi:hypothetical protein
VLVAKLCLLQSSGKQLGIFSKEMENKAVYESEMPGKMNMFKTQANSNFAILLKICHN